MSLTPMDIHNKQFDKKMRGYDEDQVDSFLDRVVDAYGDVLDKNVDLKNENVELKNEIKELKAKVDKYDKIKDSLNQSLISAQENADEIKQRAHQQANDILAEAKTAASSKEKDLKSQYETLSNDYELLKGKVSDFRDQTKKLLQDQLKELDDTDWQYYLDKYYGRSRLYPADGSQPIFTKNDEAPEQNQDANADTSAQLNINVEPDKENDTIETQTLNTVDKPDKNEVNSEQDQKEDDAPKILEGDSPVHEDQAPSQPQTNNENNGPMIIFPDDYKDHK